MAQMALLLGTDSWDKLTVYSRFLASHPRFVYRIERNYSNRWIQAIPYPLNLYFFHKNMVMWRGRCIGIFRGATWSLADIPPEYQADQTRYLSYLMFDRLERLTPVHIRTFPKWAEPQERYERGILGILRVVDIYAENTR